MNSNSQSPKTPENLPCRSTSAGKKLAGKRRKASLDSVAKRSVSSSDSELCKKVAKSVPGGRKSKHKKLESSGSSSSDDVSDMESSLVVAEGSAVGDQDVKVKIEQLSDSEVSKALLPFGRIPRAVVVPDETENMAVLARDNFKIKNYIAMLAALHSFGVQVECDPFTGDASDILDLAMFKSMRRPKYSAKLQNWKVETGNIVNQAAKVWRKTETKTVTYTFDTIKEDKLKYPALFKVMEALYQRTNCSQQGAGPSGT